MDQDNQHTNADSVALVDISSANQFLPKGFTVEDLDKDTILKINSLVKAKTLKLDHKIMESYERITADVQRISSYKNKLKELQKELETIKTLKSRNEEERDTIEKNESEGKDYGIEDLFACEVKIIDNNKDIIHLEHQIKAQERKIKSCSDQKDSMRSVIKTYNDYIISIGNTMTDLGLDQHFTIKDVLRDGDFNSRIDTLKCEIKDSISKTKNIKDFVTKYNGIDFAIKDKETS